MAVMNVRVIVVGCVNDFAIPVSWHACNAVQVTITAEVSCNMFMSMVRHYVR